MRSAYGLELILILSPSLRTRRYIFFLYSFYFFNQKLLSLFVLKVSLLLFFFNSFSFFF